MQVFFIIFLVQLAYLLGLGFSIQYIYIPWLDSLFLEDKNKDKENQLTHDSAEVEVKKEDEL